MFEIKRYEPSHEQAWNDFVVGVVARGEVVVEHLPEGSQIIALFHVESGKVVRSGWYLHGQATERFERHYADFIGTRHCIGCGNGLDALTLIFRAYKELGVLHDGDEILVPANTFVASILSITENGLRPILVEPDYETLEIDERLIESHITNRTRALLLVHLYGRCAYTGEIAEHCRRHGLLLIEDNGDSSSRWMRSVTGSERSPHSA